MTVPDDAFFARARAAAERLMVDECVISRDPNFVADSTLDVNTGALVAPSPATLNVYVGRCTVTPETRLQNESDEAGAPVVRRTYRARIPVDAPDVVTGDVLTVTSSRHDLHLVGESFHVRGALASTHAFQRRLQLEHAVRADAQ